MEITQTEIEMLKGMELSGVPSLMVDDIKAEWKAKVLEVHPVETEWGKRIEYIIQGQDDYEHKITSWNFITKKRIKPIELVGKNIILKPYSEKKLLLEVI
jgi:hypothetical protein